MLLLNHSEEKQTCMLRKEYVTCGPNYLIISDGSEKCKLFRTLDPGEDILYFQYKDRRDNIFKIQADDGEITPIFLIGEGDFESLKTRAESYVRAINSAYAMMKADEEVPV